MDTAAVGTSRDARHPEGLVARWSRRTISVSGLALALVLLGALAPIFLPLCAVLDFIRGSRLAWTRLYAFVLVYLALECAGVAAAFGLWLASGVWRGNAPERYLAWNFRLQCWWARSLARGVIAVYGLRIDVETPFENNGRPILLFVRHASVMDAVLAAVFVSAPHGIVLRYVLKRELLWDPCLDIVGNRLRNYFVDRNSEDSQQECDAVGRLAAGLEPGTGVLIYPEGTRFTPSKLNRVRDRAARRGDQALQARAETFTHVLPPRPGGAIALLENNTDADVVFCAHTGFEGAATFRDLVNGSLIGQTIHLRFWRVPNGALPHTSEARRRWLDNEWRKVNGFVEARTP